MAAPENQHSIQDDQAPSHYVGLNPDLAHFLTQALAEGDSPRVRDHVGGMHCADLAEFINQISSEQRLQLIHALGRQIDPEVLPELEPGVKDSIVELLGAERSAEAISQLESDDAVQVMEDLEEADQQEILDAFEDDAQREELEASLAYPEDSAGRLMNSKYVAVPQDWKVGQVIDFLRSDEESIPQDFYEVVITNDENQPSGIVLLSRIMRSKRDIPVQSLMLENIHTINANIDQEDAAYTFHKYGLASAPVVNDSGELVGEITIDDIVDVIDEEAEEDILRMGGLAETDLYAAMAETARKRFPWLFVNLITAIAASAVIAVFEGTIEQLVALAVLMPIVASMAGNAGTQTLTVAVRGLATKDLTSTNAKRLVQKEIAVGMVNGLSFACVVGVACFVIYGDAQLSLVFAMATVASLIIAGFAGSMIPIWLDKFGVDPAVASGVFLTTVTDIAAFFIFLGLASWWLF